MSATVIQPEEIKIRSEQGALSTYQFGTETAPHFFCNRCGIHTFVETRLNTGHYRVDLGLIDELDALRLPEVIYDGEISDATKASLVVRMSQMQSRGPRTSSEMN